MEASQASAGPRAEEGLTDHVQVSASTRGSQGGGQDQVMTDDMRLAVSALGLLRNEGSGGAGKGGARSELAPLANSTDPPVGPAGSLSANAREGNNYHPYRSTSTASTSTSTAASDAWGTGTGTSSPLTTTSITPSEGGGGGGADYFKREGAAVEGEEADPKFIERVSQLPLVSGGLEWYERSKANSRVVKYGAGLVESSFSAVSRPITNNLQLGTLDDFACRQLDRIGAPSRSPVRKDGEQLMEQERENAHTPPRDSVEEGESSPGNELALQSGGQRSRWQTVLVEAGGIGAAVSEESLKSLRYCLQWLIYATAHLDHQISTLRDFILSLRAHNRSHPSSATASSRDQHTSNALVAASASAHLSQIKHDVVETIRKVVEVVSKYAGAALPEPAKRYVKQSIMGLPVKWANAIENRGTGLGGTGASSAMDRQGSESGAAAVERMGAAQYGRVGEESTSREARERDEAEAEARAALGPTEEAADRVLTFAVESLDMLRSVASIFGESVEKAEAWIERLRIVGLQRQRQRREQEQQQGNLSIGPRPPSGANTTSLEPATYSVGGGMKRRRGATRGRHGSVADDMDEGNSGHANGEGEGGTTDGEEMIASARRKRGARSREMSAQLN